MNNSTISGIHNDETICRTSRDFNEILIEIAVRSSVSVFGTAINLLVCATFWFTPSLINSSVLLLWNLSAVDLFMCSVTIPITLRTSILHLHGYCHKPGSTPWGMAAVDAAFTASITTMLFMSLDRCFMISCPIRYKNFITVDKIKFIMITIWSFALLTPVFLLTKTFSRRVESLSTFIGLVTCYVIIGVSYFFVFNAIKKQRKVQSVADQPSNRHQSIERQLTKTIAIIIIFFTISWVPMGYTLFVYPDIEAIGNRHYLPHWAATVGMATAVINPLIYFGRKKAFRDAARGLVCNTA